MVSKITLCSDCSENLKSKLCGEKTRWTLTASCYPTYRFQNLISFLLLQLRYDPSIYFSRSLIGETGSHPRHDVMTVYHRAHSRHMGNLETAVCIAMFLDCGRKP